MCVLQDLEIPGRAELLGLVREPADGTPMAFLRETQDGGSVTIRAVDARGRCLWRRPYPGRFLGRAWAARRGTTLHDFTGDGIPDLVTVFADRLVIIDGASGAEVRRCDPSER